MTAELPDPLVPREVDLRDFAWMPIDVVRLRDSGLASDESPETCWAAMLLWCAAWHQVPAGSIPDSNQWQAKQAGYVARGRIDPAWEKVREGALRNFVLCADGRLYHRIVSEKALESWAAKMAQQSRTKAATEARRKKQQEAQDAQRDDANRQRDDARSGARDVQRDDNATFTNRTEQTGTEQTGDALRKQSSGSTNAEARTGEPTPDPAATARGEVGKALRRAGLAPTGINLDDPRMTALLDAGATPEEFFGIAKEAVEKGIARPFGWVLTVLSERRQEAALMRTKPSANSGNGRAKPVQQPVEEAIAGAAKLLGFGHKTSPADEPLAALSAHPENHDA